MLRKWPTARQSAHSIQLAWHRFLFAEDNDRWITFLRIGLGASLVFYCLALKDDWLTFFADTHHGLLSRRLSEAMTASQSRFIPTLSWLSVPAGKLGIAEVDILWFVWSLLLVAAVFLVLGLTTRFAAIASWFLHLVAAKSGSVFAYGVDEMITIGLFYLMISPVPDCLSADFLLRRVRRPSPELFGFFRRLLQLHLCLIYFFSGLAKCLGRGWWDGTSLWRALARPPFAVLPRELLARFGVLLPALGIAVCVIELFYPLFIWLQPTRKAWLLLIVGMHLGVALFMGMPLFGLVSIVLNLTAWTPGLRSKPTRCRLPPALPDPRSV